MTRKRRKTESLTARVPADLKAHLADVANAQGVDISAVVNQVLADALPGLLAWLANHRKKMDGVGNGEAIVVKEQAS